MRGLVVRGLLGLAWLVLASCATERVDAQVVTLSLDQSQTAIKERMRARWGDAGADEKQRWIALLDQVEGIARDVKDPARSIDTTVWPELATELVAQQKLIEGAAPAVRLRESAANVAELRARMVGD